MNIELRGYSEYKPHRLKRIVWAGVNALIFPIMPACLRNVLLRFFGAKIGRSLVYRNVKIYAPWNLKIGDWSCVGPRVELYNKDLLVIGSNTVVSQGAYLCTASHDVSSSDMALLHNPITLGDCVWVAAKAVVLPGVTLHEGAVAGCSAVVTKDVPPWTVVGGNPAKFIKKRELKG